MARGQSGRIVIEVEPQFKRNLYSALASDGSTLKSWFIQVAREYINEREQLRLQLPPQKLEAPPDQ